MPTGNASDRLDSAGQDALLRSIDLCIDHAFADVAALLHDGAWDDLLFLNEALPDRPMYVQRYTPFDETGAASAEAAFRRLRPNTSDFTLTYPFGSGPAAPPWIIRLVLFTLVFAACSASLETPSPSPSGAITAAATPGVTRLTPAPAQSPARPWNARTPAEVLANLPGDPNFPGAMARLSSGVEPDPRAVGRTPSLATPIFVRGLRPGDANEYIVPVTVADTTIALMKIGLDRNGLGQLDAIRGWSSTPSYPPMNESAAIARGSIAADPVIKAEFVWTFIRGSASELQPFWLLTRRSGAAMLLLEDGALVSASEYGF